MATQTRNQNQRGWQREDAAYRAQEKDRRDANRKRKQGWALSYFLLAVLHGSV